MTVSNSPAQLFRRHAALHPSHPQRAIIITTSSGTGTLLPRIDMRVRSPGSRLIIYFRMGQNADADSTHGCVGDWGNALGVMKQVVRVVSLLDGGQPGQVCTPIGIRKILQIKIAVVHVSRAR